jgi:Trypsin-like peptidase domain
MARVTTFVSLLVGLLCVGPALSSAQDLEEARRAALDRLEQRFASGAVSGTFVERTPGNYVFVPEPRDLPALPVLNPDAVPAAAVGPRLEVAATYDAANGGIRVSDYELSLISRLLRVDLLDDGDTLGDSRIGRAVARFQGKLKQALERDLSSSIIGAIHIGDDAPADDPMIEASASTAERELDAAYRDAVERGDGEERRAAVRALADVRQELKAIYGDYDNYPPWSYQQIFANSQSVVALAEPGQQNQALCSGVLIARDLVLTAGHCFKQHDPQELQVWFGFVETAGGGLPAPVGFDVVELVAPPPERQREFLERAAEERFDAEVPDYAILRFDPNGGPGLAPEVAPQCLRQADIRRGRPVYVVGYPKGTRETVHDAGRVYLPFRQTPRQFETLKKEIEVDFADLEDADRLRLLNEFTASYVERQDGATSVFELHDTRFGGQPKVGIVADTFRGNSGSPVFDRDNHCIAGILTGGAPDLGQRLGASWQFHETVLPMPAILADLKESEPTATLLETGGLDIR